MSIKGEFDDAAKEIFDSFGDVVVTGQYIVVSNSYVAGGDAGVSETPYNVRMIIEELTGAELVAIGGGGADSSYHKVMVIQSELTLAGVNPSPKDRIVFDSPVIVSSGKCTVLRSDTDPANAIWTFYLREQ